MPRESSPPTWVRPPAHHQVPRPPAVTVHFVGGGVAAGFVLVADEPLSLPGADDFCGVVVALGPSFEDGEAFFSSWLPASNALSFVAPVASTGASAPPSLDSVPFYSNR